MHGLREVDLVISHLSYEIKSQKISDRSELGPILFLTPIETKLEEVIISAEHSPKRKKWLKKFEKAFLGKSANQNNTQILNPEVLVFKENGRNLEARALDYLYIKNEALGYNLKFYLKDFILEPNRDVAYTGKVFFEDLQDSTLKKVKYKKAREKTYALSKNHFFESLVKDSLKGTLYQLGESQFLEELGSVSYKKLKLSDLTIKQGLQEDTLYIQNYLTIVDKSAKSFWYVFKGETKFATSFIGSKTGKIVLSRNGTILNPKDIEEIGFWAQHRVADLLPLDYKQVRIPTPPSLQLLDSLSQFVQNQPQEKVYLHLNKPYYAQGEEIWLKAYLLDASSHLPRTKSKVIYTELIDPKGKIVDSLMFHTDKGTSGRFALRKQELTGTYQVRAYTQHMRNQDPAFYFQQAIQVYAYAGDALGKRQEKSDITELDNHTELNPIEVRFYPEGGELIAGFENHVAFEITRISGLTEEIEISILSQQGELIATRKPLFEGIGAFSFVPQVNQTYQAKVNYEGNTYAFPLPAVLPTGYILQAENLEDDSVRIKVAFSEDLDPKGAFLVGHVRGNINFFVEELVYEQIFTVPKAPLHRGVFHLTLFDNEGRPQAERVFFNEKGYNDTLLSISKGKDRSSLSHIDLQFSLSDKIPSVESSSLSVSVTDQSLVQYPRYSTNIKNYLYLNSDVTNPIASADFYLNPESKNLEALDLLFMTRAWRRFTWRDVQEEKQKETYAAEQGYSIAGYVASANDSTKRAQAQVMLNSLDQQLYVEQTKTDAEGNFTFSDIPLMDSALYILQSRTQKESDKEEEISMKGKRTVNVFLSPMSRPKVKLKPYTSSVPRDTVAWQSYMQQAYLEDSLTGMEIDLEEVTITASSGLDSRLFNVYNLDKLDWVPDHTSSLNLLSMLKAGNVYELDRITDKMVIIKTYRGQRTKFPVTFFVNDMLTTFNGFQGLTADVISYIGFFGKPVGSVIVVRTRLNGPRSLEKELEKGILDYMHPGYDLAREFYTPNARRPDLPASRPALQSAIYWEPMLNLDKEGKARLSFNANENVSTYQVRVEGITSTGIPIFETFSFQKE